MTKHNQRFKFLALFAVVLSICAASPVFAESAGHYIDDATITAKVKAAILADSQLKVLQVSVDTSHGTVLLSGAVDSTSQESEAVKVANQVDGVIAVTNNMSLKSAQSE